MRLSTDWIPLAVVIVIAGYFVGHVLVFIAAQIQAAIVAGLL